jgi:starch synthase
MLAMRAAQPCVVHGVGGLKDTVRDNRSGFVFNGSTPTEQANALVDSVNRAVALKSTHNDAWQKICIRAASARFSWSESAQQTIEQLYDNA